MSVIHKKYEPVTTTSTISTIISKSNLKLTLQCSYLSDPNVCIDCVTCSKAASFHTALQPTWKSDNREM